MNYHRRGGQAAGVDALSKWCAVLQVLLGLRTQGFDPCVGKQGENHFTTNLCG
ncbi:hypothetical protein [Bacillus sp. B1-b2]|uniref:hypothetical protein n=1 Tax=Bacillus sp. B1-b2 TaxID=2653201 RepID=UPI00186A5A1A|nr:hypothetical protein [Bacillus sp. B1-b2]